MNHIMGPLPRSRAGFKYLLVIKDIFKDRVEYCAFCSATGQKIAEAIEELVINRLGTPQVLLVDNGTEFANTVLRSLGQEYNIYRTTAPPCHPQANLVQRINTVLKTIMVPYLDRDHSAWEMQLAEFWLVKNTGK